jgi:hypothetical protein
MMTLYNLILELRQVLSLIIKKRKNKAGGGILKQAGDSSGPPPESGPNVTRVARSNETWYQNIGVLNGRNR